MKVICTKDVVMNTNEKYGKYSGKRVFTKGKLYKARHHTTTLEDPWTPVKVLRATNDFNDRHIIKHCYEGANNTFFENHFLEVQN
ncbi:hypothetical protein P4V72_05785 [Bacillus thuringiensis]|uniref:Uncharacterized protein n=2 Tax=root TaxID=1 RepID=A0A4P8MX72_9CAUD|nr:hypothetical protein [Bacillus thuringiensis]YP_009845491.1 hypothetical protein HWC18_gp55 [Bacillus phage vB_BtS_B83]MEB9095249.1 hypothetical protein [Bacillus cereus]AMR06457.1 hypothetical protein AXW78_29595 [Bacillus thuringiensis]MEC3575151.1 hypothetical protein [Bacillus thuringiensis]MED2021927.1 hypothetical protein [Bacillus thuringiensis]MED2140711.1 hypothetical protein [Bacillus thuringiensis]